MDLQPQHLIINHLDLTFMHLQQSPLIFNRQLNPQVMALTPGSKTSQDHVFLLR